jgi:anthranilate/para-aminobenzoate synthase component II
MRYHSLVADPARVPPCLEVTAWCKDGTVMGVRHRQHDVFGVQFHPESIGTASGRALVAAFLDPHAPARTPRAGAPSDRPGAHA